MRFQPLERDNRVYVPRLRAVVWMTVGGFLPFWAASSFVPGSFRTLLRVVAIICPVIGFIFFKIIDAVVDRLSGSLFWPDKGHTARAHSEGEALVQRQKFEEAIEWFTETVDSDPTDWQAQLRIVEILTNHIFDAARAAEARNRLLKIEGVGEGLWINTALRLGKDWEDLGRPDRAINTYKSLLWKYEEGYDADEIRRRLALLGAKHE